jgi:Lipid A core - O-antigen ligase and related enzymes
MKKHWTNNTKVKAKKEIYDFSVTQWVALIGVAVFFLYTPHRQGLFNGFTFNFELQIFEALMLGFAGFLIALAYIARRMKYDSIEFILGIGMLLMPLIHWISSFQAVSYHNAVLMVFIYGIYAAFFLTAMSLVSTRGTRTAAELIVFLSGYAVVFVGLLAATGQVSIRDSIWFTSGTYRLTSIFQYSNTYAGFLLAYFLCAAFAAVNARRTITACLHALMLVPIWISFMLTYSRGALVLVPVLVLIFLVFMRLDRQIAFLGAIVVSCAAAFVIMSPYTENYIGIAERVMPKVEGEKPYLLPLRDPAVVKAWLMLPAASVAAVLCVWGIRAARPWLDKRLARWTERRYAAFVLPAAGALFGLLASVMLFGTGIADNVLPRSIADRIANINFRQHSVLERFTFYRDALKLSADYPLLGAGGGGWNALFEQYQNNPYVSRQTHSYFFQTLVEVGWIGLVVLVVLIGGVVLFYLHHYWRERMDQPRHFVFFILSFSILTHSMIDFDMSFVYIGALVFFALGVLGAVYRDKLRFPRLSALNQGYRRYIYPAFLGIAAIALLVQVFQEYVANGLYRKALYMATKEKRPLHELLVPLDQAIANSPAHPEYAYMKIDWLSQAFRATKDRSYAELAQAEIRRVKAFESFDRQILLAQYRNHKDLQEYIEAIAVLEEGISKFPWDIKFYEAAVMEYAVNGRDIQDTDSYAAEAYWNRGLQLYEEVLRRMNMLATLPEEQLQGRNFQITPFLRQAIGQIYYASGQYEEAADILAPLKDGDLSDPYIRIGIRYYLASLDKMGQSDENLMKRLIEADANERFELDALLQEST